jgi:hypothetical protein
LQPSNKEPFKQSATHDKFSNKKCKLFKDINFHEILEH